MELFSYSREGTIFTCSLYISIGTVAALCSIMNICIWLTNRELRRRCIYLIALDACELVNAISYFLVATGRILALNGNYLSTPITKRGCFFGTYWPHSLILGTQLPSFMILLIACERICAVLSPISYKKYFTGYSKILILSTVPIVGLVSMVVGGLAINGKEGDILNNRYHCGVVASTTLWYSTSHFIFTVIAYIISFISIFIVWRITKKNSSEKYGGDNRLGVMLMVTGSSVLLVGSEAIVQVIMIFKLTTISDMVILTHAFPGFLSVVNSVLNFVFRPEFRQQFFVLTGIRKNRVFEQSMRTATIQIRPLQTVTNH